MTETEALASDVDFLRGEVDELKSGADIQDSLIREVADLAGRGLDATQNQIDKIERALYALANGAYEPVAAANYAKSILLEDAS